MDQEYPGFLNVIRALPSDKTRLPSSFPCRDPPVELAALLVSLQHGCIDLCTSQQSAYNTAMRWHPADRRQHWKKCFRLSACTTTPCGKLEKLDGRRMEPPAWMIRGEQEILLKDTAVGCCGFAVDAVHHRGQLSTYKFVRWREGSGHLRTLCDDTGV